MGKLEIKTLGLLETCCPTSLFFKEQVLRASPRKGSFSWEASMSSSARAAWASLPKAGLWS